MDWTSFTKAELADRVAHHYQVTLNPKKMKKDDMIAEAVRLERESAGAAPAPGRAMRGGMRQSTPGRRAAGR